MKESAWNKSEADVFWSEIAPCDHILQIYDNDKAFLDTLTTFVTTGIEAGDCTIVIATESHLKGLEDNLRAKGLQLGYLKADDLYIPLNAEETLEKFMVDGWPDERLFNKTISEIIERAHCRTRKVRAFGEMVAILWAEGNNGATVRLESLWNDYMHKAPFLLFCAYPKSGSTQDLYQSMDAICACHSKLVKPANSKLEILYTGAFSQAG
jgi:hypothetical protein